VANYTAQVFVCPSSTRTSFGRLAYGMMATSTPERKVSLEKQQSMFDKAKRLGYVAGSSPALWQDRTVYPNGGGSGNYPTESNHNPSRVPKGGNVVHLDGSGSWYRFAGINRVFIEDVMWAQNPNDDGRAAATSTFYLISYPTNDQKTVYANGGTSVYWGKNFY
jgi:hypothetical protein